MATETPSGTERRGSVLGPWRMFASGPQPVVAVFVGFFVLALVWMSPGRRAIAPSVFMVVAMLPFVTWVLERQLANRLAFMSLVPQPIQPKWLVLAPMCALACVLAALTPVLGRAPLIATLAVLGSAWWTIGSVRWLHGVGLWALVVWPAVILAPAASFAAHRVGGWVGSAAVAMAMGVGALLLQPRAYVGRPLPRPGESEDEASGASVRRSPRPIAVAPAHGTSALATGARFFVAASGVSPRFLVPLIMLMVVIGVMFSGPRNALQPALIWMLFIGGQMLGTAHAAETREFLAAKPLTDSARVIGGLVFPLLLLLITPLTAACLINRQLVDHGGALGWLLGHKAPREDEIRFLREVLGATFIPEKWPAGGLPLDLWLKLRPLLVHDRLRSALLMATLTFAVAPFMGRAGKKRPALNIVLVSMVFIAMVRLEGLIGAVPVPPLWLSALLAAIAIADFVRRARLAATGSSTGG